MKVSEDTIFRNLHQNPRNNLQKVDVNTLENPDETEEGDTGAGGESQGGLGDGGKVAEGETPSVLVGV